MIRSRRENRKPFAPAFLKIQTHQDRCNKVAPGGRPLRGNLVLRGCGDHGSYPRNFSRFCRRFPRLAISSAKHELAAANSCLDVIRVLGTSEFLNFRLL